MSPAALCRVFCLLSVAIFANGCAGYTHLKPFFGNNAAVTAPPAEPAPTLGLSLPKLPKLPNLLNKPRNSWDGDGATGAASIVIKLDEQRAYFYRGKKVVGTTRISTGKTGFNTPPGTYYVIQKDKDHTSTLYGDYVNAEGEVVKTNVDTSKDHAPAGATYRGAKMPYFLRFRGGYGLHAGRVPNYPASHGCVRLPAEMARRFFENAEVGTPIRIEE